jgi:hypothetical protein
LAGKLLALCMTAAAAGAFAQETIRLVLKGYDPVAYFTVGKPTKGDPRFSHDWDGSRYLFASARHRDMFAADPERFAPQFGGYCTGSMSRNVRNEGDPEGWVIQDGKLYVFGNTSFRPSAEADPNFIPSRIENARRHWSEFRQKPAS